MVMPTHQHVCISSDAPLFWMHLLQRIPVIGTWHSNYSDYLKFYHIDLMRSTVEKYIRSFYVNMPIFVPVSEADPAWSQVQRPSNYFLSLLLSRTCIQTPFIRTRLLDNGFPKSRVGIWGRGVNLKHFCPSNRSMSFRRSKSIEDDEVVILWVGRLVKEKSPDLWAEVIRRLHRDGLKFRALVVGTGSCEDEMKTLPRTECLGWLGGKALAGK